MHHRPLFLYAAASGLIWFTFVNLWPFIASFFEAVILFVLFNRLYLAVRRKTGSSLGGASVVIGITFVIIIVPLLLLMPLVISSIPRFYKSIMILANNPMDAIQWPDFLQVFIASNTVLVNKILPAAATQLVSKIGDVMLATIGNIGGFFVNIIIMYVILFFALIEQDLWIKTIVRYWPSKPAYLNKITSIFKETIYSFVISTVVIALFQGLSLGVAMVATQTPNSFMLTLIACVLSFIPIIGVPFVWIPVAIYHSLTGAIAASGTIAIVGLVISNIDNLIRPWVQNKIGKIHPMTTIFGIIIGIPLFGISGLVIGPVLIALTASLSGLALENYNYYAGRLSE